MRVVDIILSIGLFSLSFQVNECEANAEALQAKRAAAAAALAAEAAAEQAAIDTAAAAAVLQQAAAAKKAREAAASAARLKKSAEDALIWGEYSNSQDSPTYHVTNKFLLKSVANTDYCMSLPPADTFNGYKNGRRDLDSPNTYMYLHMHTPFSFHIIWVVSFFLPLVICMYIAGQGVILSTCDTSDSSQHFFYDTSSNYIHPGIILTNIYI
jgi:hypothetical protein